MRRLAAITLVTMLLVLTSSAMSIACAASCAQMAQPASAMPGMDMPMAHQALPASHSFAATHCAGYAPRLLAQRIVTPQSPHSAALLPNSAQAATFRGATGVARASFAASPPGPPLSPTQLRI